MKRERGKNLTSEKNRKVTIFLVNPTADGLVGGVVEGHALHNHGFQEETWDFTLHLIHGFQGIHLWMGGFDSKALPCWNSSLNKKKGRLKLNYLYKTEKDLVSQLLCLL